jgi:hypothetical protein
MGDMTNSGRRGAGLAFRLGRAVPGAAAAVLAGA